MYLNCIRIIFLRIAWAINFMLWRVITLLKWNKQVILEDFNKIIFNRKDRIWDAVITKPLLILFAKYVKEELKLDIDIEIECSEYNKFVFDDDQIKKHCKIIEKNCEINNYWESVMKMIIKYLNFPIKKNNKKNKDTIYVDLIWNYHHLDSILDKNYFIIWPNYWIKNYLLDFSLNHSFVRNAKANLIETYTSLLSSCFDLTWFKDYINKNLEFFYEDYNYKNKSWIMIFVWNKEFRNLSIDIRYKLILWIGEKRMHEKIIVLDDNNNTMFKKLKKLDFPKNVEIIENKFSLNEFKDYAKNFELLIWIDGWWFNYIRTVTDSLEIFTLANSKVWSIFTWDYKYKKKKLWKYILNEVNILGKKFGYIEKKNFFLPSYDYELPKGIFKDFPVDKILSEI